MHAVNNYFSLHLKNAQDAFSELHKKPVASLLTVIVIGIALAMPAALNILVKNGRGVTESFDDIRDFSIYINHGITIQEANNLADNLRLSILIKKVKIISADEALADFKKNSGFEAALITLDSNPLPHTLVVTPKESTSSSQILKLVDKIRSKPEIDQIRIDSDWVNRLDAILDLLKRSVSIASVLLITAVVIIVGNTIRLDIQNRHNEIEILQLLGASNGFVRRPFLYVGLSYGLLGGLFGVILLALSAAMLTEPLERLTGLYQSSFILKGLDSKSMGTLLLGGVISGWGGAWIAVSRHMSANSSY